MGSFSSKVWNEVNEYYYKDDNLIKSSGDSQLGTPDSNLTVRNVAVDLDPRSPALQFERTPIQVIDSKQKYAIDLESLEKMIQNVTLLTTVDPRSPTFGIERTPIDLGSHDSIAAKISSMHLSFDSNVSDLIDNSFESLISDEKCLSSTPLTASKEIKKTEDKSGQRVRTPLGYVQQKQTPNRKLIKRNQLEITKRAHLNSHLKKTQSKTIADNASENSFKGHHIIDDKENY